MKQFTNKKFRLAGTLITAFVISGFLIRYVFPTKSTTVNPNFATEIKKDLNYFIAGLVDKNAKEHIKQFDALRELAKTGTYTPVENGVEKIENKSGAAFRVTVNAMDWEEYKTYVINGKEIRIRVEKGQPDPSQELLEKLANYY